MRARTHRVEARGCDGVRPPGKGADGLGPRVVPDLHHRTRGHKLAAPPVVVDAAERMLALRFVSCACYVLYVFCVCVCM